jgi:tetratricopeptide (TPR) repeat protein
MDAWHEWKWIQWQPAMTAGNPLAGGYTPFDVLTWRPAPRLIEWGCALLRREPTPRSTERWWQLGALAVAHRSEDHEFLVGDPTGAIGNPQKEIEHLDHVVARFPDEARFVLGGGIALEWRFADEARATLEAIRDHVDVGGEATMRLGAIVLRKPRRGESAGDAIDLLKRAEPLTRDPYVIFLARYFKGRAFEKQKRTADAERAYRGAVAAVPHAQSATTALATLLFGSDRRAEAHRLASAMIAADPQPADPWREYAHGDDRFWPEIIARLRAEIRR